MTFWLSLNTNNKVKIHKPKIVQFETYEQFEDKSVDFIVRESLNTTAFEGLFRIALAGGSTPFPIYKKTFNSAVFPLEQTEIYQVDERMVSPLEDQSNLKKIKSSIGSQNLPFLKKLVYFDTTSSTTKALQKYELELNQLDEPLFDLIVLGVGTDGHIASLFAGGDYFGSKNFAIETTAPQKYPTKQRLTLSLQSILNCKKILILLSGEAKGSILVELLEGSELGSDYPVKFLLAHPNLFIYQWLG